MFFIFLLNVDDEYLNLEGFVKYMSLYFIIVGQKKGTVKKFKKFSFRIKSKWCLNCIWDCIN